MTARVTGNFLLQRIFGTLSGVAAVMHFPLALLAPGEGTLSTSIVVLAALVLFSLAFVFNRGVAGLVEGTADHRIRGMVRQGTRVAWILVALTPLSLLAVILNPQLEGRGFWLTVLVLGAAVLIAYFRQAAKYWTHVESVA